MNMTFRWYGKNHDPIPLSHIKQIPNCKGVVCTLMDIPAGEVWPVEDIMAMKRYVNSFGLHMDVIESVNVHEDIKLGAPSRDHYIANYKQTIRNLQKAGVKVICYNFMPIFDWTRTQLAKPLLDGSNVLSYDQSIIDKISNPRQLVDLMNRESKNTEQAGWEPERLAHLEKLFKLYEGFTAETLFANLKYFLEQIIPVCEECGINMAIHPDDPPWDIFGLPRIANNKANFDRICSLVDSPCNGLTLCTGSAGANPDNDMVDMIYHFGGKKRIHFTHIRNVKIHEKGKFDEASHFTIDGSLDMFGIVKAFYDVGFTGYARPDHGRMIWDEKGRPGYGLYDRALGITYLNGLWEAIRKMSGK